MQQSESHTDRVQVAAVVQLESLVVVNVRVFGRRAVTAFRGELREDHRQHDPVKILAHQAVDGPVRSDDVAVRRKHRLFPDHGRVLHLQIGERVVGGEVIFRAPAVGTTTPQPAGVFCGQLSLAELAIIVFDKRHNALLN